MGKLREVASITRSRLTLEGAGVKLKRAVGFGDEFDFDPFLLLDDIHSPNPADYVAGFPWHPHRGIETVTYLLSGTVAHGDSIGNSGTIGPGEIQWMTAGSGIVHQEMPRPSPGVFRGLQLWVNLPAAKKMMAPRYRSIAADEVAAVVNEDGSAVRVIAGSFGGVTGPAKDLVQDPSYFDVTLPPLATLVHPFPEGHTVFAYVLEGGGTFGNARDATRDEVALFSRADGDFHAAGGPNGMRFLLISGAPLGEPIAWRGPIVMNTPEELETAFLELDAGTFIKG